MKDLLAGKKIEDFEKALFSDDEQSWQECFWVGLVGGAYLVATSEKHLNAMISDLENPTMFDYMKPLPKQTPLSDLEIKEALVGVIVEADSSNFHIAYHREGPLNYDYTEDARKFGICGYWFELEHLKKFKNPTTRKMEPITRENLINAGLLND